MLIPILFYADTTNVGLIVAMNLQKRPVKKLALIPVFCSVCFIQRSIISVEVPLYGFNVVIKRAASDDSNSLLSRSCDNAVTGHNLGFWGNA